MWSAILEELKLTKDNMNQLYNEMILLHEVIVPLVEIQQISQEILKVLKVVGMTMNLVEDWGIKYLNISKQLVKKTLTVELNRTNLWLHSQNYNQLGEHVTNTIVAYVQFHSSLESITRNHKVLSMDSLGEIRSKDVIM